MTNPTLEEFSYESQVKNHLKVIVSRPDLVSLIGKIQSIVPTKPTMPILVNILVEAFDNLLTITATDLTVSMKVYAEAKVESEGSITIPAKRFFQLIRELTTERIELEAKDELIFIRSGSSFFKLNTTSKDEFPKLPDLYGGDFFTINSEKLKELLSKTSFAAARDDSRPELNGIFMKIQGSKLTFIGTNGKKLGKINEELPSCAIQGEYIIPIKAIEEVLKILEENHPVKIFIYEDKIAIETHVITIISKLLSGEYPDVSRVIPSKADIVVHFNKEELTASLKQISLFTTELKPSVKLTFTKGHLELSAKGSLVGEGNVSVPVDFHGEKFEIALNPSCFIDILRHCKNQTINLGLVDSFTPGIITDQSTALFIIMPMRLDTTS